MTKKEIQYASVSIVSLAVLSEFLWLYEINTRFGWANLMWLQKDLWSAWLICACAATAYMLPFIVTYRQIDSKVALTWLTLICLNLSVYYIGEAVLKNLFSQLDVLLSFWDSLLMRLWGLFAVAIFAFGYHWVTAKLIMDIHKQQVILFLISAVSMFFLGNLTVMLFQGYGNGNSMVDAIKMGYPQFWICILLGASSILTITHFSNEKAE